MEHSHGFNLEAVEGGHYHTDTTPDTVEYLAYYNVAECKGKTNLFGRVEITLTFA